MRQCPEMYAEVTEDHHHNEQFCIGNNAGVAAYPAAHAASGFLTPFQLTSAVAASAFGVPTQLSAGGLGSLFWDFDEIFVPVSQRVDETYCIEFYAGSGLFAASTRISALFYRAASNNSETFPLAHRSRRFLGTLNLWARCCCTFAGASTIDILLLAHNYSLDTALGDEVIT